MQWTVVPAARSGGHSLLLERGGGQITERDPRGVDVVERAERLDGVERK